MLFPLYIAKRYLISRSSQNAINIINIITFLVIVVGTAALFIVLSGFSGLKTFSLSFSNKFDPDLKAIALKGKFFDLTQVQQEKLANVEGLALYAPEVEERILLAYKEKNEPVYIKGVQENYTLVTQVDSTLYFGKWLDNTVNEVVVGIGIANTLGISVNDYLNPIKILAPKPGKGSFSNNKKAYNELSVLASGFYAINEELDKKYIFAPLPMVQALLDKDSTQITGINFKIQPKANVNNIKEQIANIFNGAVEVKTRSELNVALYKMLNTENMAVYSIFTLVLIIALFNVIGAIIMMILDKKENLKTLFNIGATITHLKQIFFLQGILLAFIGGVAGVLLALFLVWSQLQFGWLKITPSFAYPVEIHFKNIVIVMATILVLGFIAAKIASSRISKKLIVKM